MRHTYSPRPLRESSQNRHASAIQADIEFMRAMYAQRRNLNTPRHQSLVGWSLVTVMAAAPVIAAIIFLATR